MACLFFINKLKDLVMAHFGSAHPLKNNYVHKSPPEKAKKASADRTTDSSSDILIIAAIAIAHLLRRALPPTSCHRGALRTQYSEVTFQSTYPDLASNATLPAMVGQQLRQLTSAG